MRYQLISKLPKIWFGSIFYLCSDGLQWRTIFLATMDGFIHQSSGVLWWYLSKNSNWRMDVSTIGCLSRRWGCCKIWTFIQKYQGIKLSYIAMNLIKKLYGSTSSKRQGSHYYLVSGIWLWTSAIFWSRNHGMYQRITNIWFIRHQNHRSKVDSIL